MTANGHPLDRLLGNHAATERSAGHTVPLHADDGRAALPAGDSGLTVRAGPRNR